MIDRNINEMICAELCQRHNSLILWKHIEKGLKCDGDIDTIAPFQDVDAISDSFRSLVFKKMAGVVAVVECRHISNVRPHFLIDADIFPKLLQFDISWRPQRIGVSWCDPRKLVEFSMMTDKGIRILRPGAQSIVLLMLYGLSLKGCFSFKNDDLESIKQGLRSDEIGATQFCDIILPKQLSPFIKAMIPIIRKSDWQKKLSRNALLKILQMALLDFARKNPIKSVRLLKNRKKPLCNLQKNVHHNHRIASEKNLDRFIDCLNPVDHFIVKRQER